LTAALGRKRHIKRKPVSRTELALIVSRYRTDSDMIGGEINMAAKKKMTAKKKTSGKGKK